MYLPIKNDSESECDSDYREPLALINKSQLKIRFFFKLLSNSMSGLLPSALVCPLTSQVVYHVIYVYDHVVGPGCHGQQDGNLQINAPTSAFTLQPCFIETKIIKLCDCLFRCSASFPPPITWLRLEGDYHAVLIVEIIFNIKKQKIIPFFHLFAY